MASTANSNNSSVSQDLDGSYAYSSIGLYFLFLGVIAVISLSIYYCTRCLQNRQGSSTGSPSMGSTIQFREEEANRNSYPVLLYSQAKLHRPDSATTTSPCCSICLADYKDTEWLKLLPDCAHMFHRDCIDMWLRLNLTCPLCRTSPLPTPLSQVAPLATRHA